MKIKLTPGQGVSIHGWMAARVTLSWGDVLARDDLDFSVLLKFNIPMKELHALQPDLDAWVRAKKTTLSDCPGMGLWGAHPVKDFKADLADVVSMKWSSETMGTVGLTYEELVGLGMTHDSMILFNQLTLMGWTTIGLRRQHCENIPTSNLYRMFGMSKFNILTCLK